MPLHWAAWNGHLPLLRLLDPGSGDAAVGVHALRWAAARGHGAAARALARRVGDARDEQGAGPRDARQANDRTADQKETTYLDMGGRDLANQKETTYLEVPDVCWGNVQDWVPRLGALLTLKGSLPK